MNNRTARGTRLGLFAAAALAIAVPVSLAGTAAASTPVASAPTVVRPVEQWTSRTVAPGVEVRTGTVTNPASVHTWTVTVHAPATNRLTGAPTWAPVGTQAWAAETEGKLRAAGFEPRVTPITWPGYADTPRGLMGVRVRIGSFATQAEASGAASKVTAAGFRTAVDWTGYDADQPADRENINVAVIDPRRFRGTVEATHDGNVAQRETTSSVAAKLGSLVGVNGGFFLTSSTDGVQGNVAGVAAYDGELASMAVGARAALIIEDGGRRNRIADLTTTVTARVGHATFDVGGVNRTPGLVRNCGRPGGVPTSEPRHDVTCTLADDMVAFTGQYVRELPAGPGAQAVLDSRGRVLSAGPRGGTVTPGQTVLQGIGAASGWLTEHAVPGAKVSVKKVVRDTRGRKVELGPDDSIVSAAPTLVEDGRVHIDAATEGTLDPLDLSFGYAWSNVRQPRTMAGIDRQGRLLLVTVDGRLSGGSEGFTLAEGAAFMRSLGAEQALNLDGGGSSAMVVQGTLVNRPSDAAGERAVGDTIQVLPGH
ncbi:phosphodiester glycosidase family protein [Sphaerisporangium sp. B11E5]|uniref:phosphodiester glycosidase family protein n=1 Tax=Sphaerisporangium sp. B11E5 TaxID=3153563 RepID=UPI00325CE7D9